MTAPTNCKYTFSMHAKSYRHKQRSSVVAGSVGCGVWDPTSKEGFMEGKMLSTFTRCTTTSQLERPQVKVRQFHKSNYLKLKHRCLPIFSKYARKADMVRQIKTKSHFLSLICVVHRPIPIARKTANGC